MITSIERQTMKKVYLRLLPFCFVLYFICYLDRVNIGFAALTMNKDLGLSSYIFGLGAGAFFWGYFLLEVLSCFKRELSSPLSLWPRFLYPSLPMHSFLFLDQPRLFGCPLPLD